MSNNSNEMGPVTAAQQSLKWQEDGDTLSARAACRLFFSVLLHLLLLLFFTPSHSYTHTIFYFDILFLPNHLILWRLDRIGFISSTKTYIQVPINLTVNAELYVLPSGLGKQSTPLESKQCENLNP